MDIPSASSSEYGQPNSVFLDTVNDFFIKYGLDPVPDLSDISAPLLLTVFEIILGDRPRGILGETVTREDEVHNVQCLIDHLGEVLLHCDLSHIRGTAIVDGDETSIKYLMDIFMGFESFLMELEGEGSEEDDVPLDRDFTTRGTIDTISQVLQEEGLRSPPTRDVESENSIRSGDSKLPSSISGDLDQHEIESDISIEGMLRPGDSAVYTMPKFSGLSQSEIDYRLKEDRSLPRQIPRSVPGTSENFVGGHAGRGTAPPYRWTHSRDFVQSEERQQSQVAVGGQHSPSETHYSRLPRSTCIETMTYSESGNGNVESLTYQRPKAASGTASSSRQTSTGKVSAPEPLLESRQRLRHQGGEVPTGRSNVSKVASAAEPRAAGPRAEGPRSRKDQARRSPPSVDTSESLSSTQELIRLGDEAMYGKSAMMRNVSKEQPSRKGTRIAPVSPGVISSTRDVEDPNQRDWHERYASTDDAGHRQSSAESVLPRSQPLRGEPLTNTGGGMHHVSRVPQTRPIQGDPKVVPRDISVVEDSLKQRSSRYHANDVVQREPSQLVRFDRSDGPASRDRSGEQSGASWDKNVLRQRDLSQHREPPSSAGGVSDCSDQNFFRELEPSRDSQASWMQIPARTSLSRERKDVRVLQNKDPTCSSFSSAGWPEPPPSDHREGELASLGTGLPTEDQRRTRPSMKRGVAQKHTHTHHHYHQPVVLDAGRTVGSQGLTSSLPITSGRSRPIPPVSSTLMASTSAPTSPVRGYADNRHPSRQAFTPPRRPPEKERRIPATHTDSTVIPKQRETNIEQAPPLRVEQSRGEARPSRVTKSRSWEEGGAIRKEKLCTSKGQTQLPKSKSFEMYDVAGPSEERRSQPSREQPPGPSKRKVAFHLTADDSEVDDDDELNRLAEMAVLNKLRNRIPSSSDTDDSDSDISVHSDSIINYSRGSDIEEMARVKPRKSSQKSRRSKRGQRSPVSGSLLLGRSPPRGKPPRVRFEEALESQAGGTMSKIRREIGKDKRRQDIERKTIEFLYAAGLRELQQDMEEQDEKRRQLVRKQNQEYKCKVLKKPKTSISQPARKYAPRLVPPVSPRRGRHAGRVPPVSPRRSRQASRRVKRKRSPSPRIRRQKRMTVGDDDVLPLLMTEFPFLHVSPETAHAMWTKQLRQVEQLAKIGVEQSKNNQMQKKIEDAEQRQKLLMSIMKKELSHNQRMKELKEKRSKKMLLQRKEREKRHVTARARRYYGEFRVQAQAKMAKKATREEKIFKNLFEEALKIQKSRILELRKYARDKGREMAGRQQDEIESMENFYHDQFNLLAEALQKERRDLTIKDNAQAKVLGQMKRSMRRRMEDEIREYQAQLHRDEDSTHYRGLDAERIKQGLRDAAYKTQL